MKGMKIVHIESGLGNQMLSYCELLALKKANPGDECLVETIVYDLPECNEVVCQWNGYELERIFHVGAPNVRQKLSAEQWDSVMQDIRRSVFWTRNWNYPVCFTEAFRRVGLDLKNVRGNFEEPGHPRMTILGEPAYRRTSWFRYLRYLKRRLAKAASTNLPNYEAELFMTTDDNLFTGQKLLFKYRNSGIERIADEVRTSFRFPPVTDERNAEALRHITSAQSIGIHARRGDMLGYNYDCYVGGYFRRCVSFLRAHIGQPVFYIFCDPDSVAWAKANSHVFGLDFSKDEVHFVDWNTGMDSWRDMQLMAACRHQVVTRSSFGWWAAWLNENPDKITCSPDYDINTTHHF